MKSIAALVTLFTLSLSSAPQAQGQQLGARPIIELEKSRFDPSEEVFFWVGVTTEGDQRIPQSLWNTCRLTITRPDGSERIDPVSWPIDGMLDRGWRGGHLLSSEPLQFGRYVLVFEVGGVKTSPYTITIEHNPIPQEISGEFLFSSPLALGSPDATVTLTVRNGSSQTIRFPHRGVMFGHVSVWLNKTTGEKWSSSFAVPEPLLLQAAGIAPSTIAEDTFSWALAGRVPTVVLTPGETYRLQLPLSGVLAGHPGPIPDGEFDVQLSTDLQMLVGQPDGPGTDRSTIRVKVVSMGRGILGKEKTR